MTTAPQRSKPRVRFSIFARCALITAVATGIVAATILTSSFRATTDLANDGLRAKAEAVTRAIAAPAGGAIRFGRTETVDTELRRLLDAEDGAAVAALVVDANGQTLAAEGEEAGTLSTALAAVAADSMARGTTASDGFLIAQPVIFGESNAIVGAVAIAWSPDEALATIRESKISILALGLSVLIAALAAGVFYLQFSVTRPLRDVGRAMKNVVSGRYDTTIPAMGRGDEIGLMARDLEYFRGMMEQASAATKAAMFQSAAFQSSRAAMLLADRDFNITHTNDAFDQIIRDSAEDFREALPGIDLGTLAGRNIDVFHRDPDRNRQMLTTPGALPMVTDIRLGKAVHQLRVNGVHDEGGGIAGYVIEWTDVTTARRDAAVLRGLEATQVGLRFAAGWAFADGNGQFTAAGGDAKHLSGRSMRDLVEAEGLGAAELEDRLAGGSPVNGRFRVELGTAGRRTLDGSFCPILDAKGRPVGFQLLGRDITEEVRALADAEAARATLEAAQARVVDALRTGLTQLREGDLTHRIETPLGADYETLREDFNAAIDGLRDTVLGVTEMVDTIRTDVREITGAAEDLSRRTEHQAATLEETAAALAQITAAVNSAAEGARNARAVVGEARGNAESSGRVVQDAVSAMGEIANSSSRISRIVSVIDDIAFQTNLLALNAGVEAARAGDAGRGFAVVASEVRALAQRSSEAAREIGGLIAASAHQVETGVTLVGEAGEALRRISASVNGISDHVADIAGSAQEQSASLTEVNTSMSQLDQVTQQNAAMFEETTAASQNLVAQADALSTRMARFRVGRAPASAARARPAAHPGPRRELLAAPPVSGNLALKPADDDWEDF
ncbi:MAG: methyl-accepting chemotaxis protein [Rhodobacteraceae bacterium]|nr:methyl-accepting chemotaxis protein [Paracoccaceae bacterium]